jgi:hypothetical protein
MANWFVRSLATGTGTGADWTNAFTTLSLAITASTAGDTFFVADDHAQTVAASLTLSFKGGTTVATDIILCVDHTVTSPTSADLKTTATVTTTGAGSTITVNGSFYMYGISFNQGTSTGGGGNTVNGTTSQNQLYDTCNFNVVQTGATSINVGAAGSKTRWTNCKVTLTTGQFLQPATGAFEWVDTPSAISGATPTSALFSGNLISGSNFLEGVDLSALGSGKTIVSATSNSSKTMIKDCKLGASVTVSANNFPGTAGMLDVIRSDSGNTNFRCERYHFTGTQTTETTIARSGGATDGTTAFSHKVVTGTKAIGSVFFELLPLAIWNDTTGSAKTITIECISSAVLNNDECWMEVEYLGNASFPAGSRASTYKTNILATGAANTTSTATWGGVLTGKFKMAVTITPQQKGPITVYVKVAKASTTVYVDPMITVT